MRVPQPTSPSSGVSSAWTHFTLRSVAVGLLALLVFAAYQNSFRVPYLLDDPDSIEKNPTITSWATALHPPRDSGVTVSGRPLLNLSLAINYHLHGTQLTGYHVGNLLVHFAATLALFGVVRRTLLLPSMRESFGQHATILAWFVAALWALHPIQTESVTYIIQRAESLVGLFYLLCVYCFIRSTERPSRVWPLACVAACFLGMAAKEVMVTAPVMIVLYDRAFVSGSFRASWQQHRKLILGLAASWLLLAALLISSGTRGTSVGFAHVSAWEYLITQASGISGYLVRSLVPLNLIFDYGPRLILEPAKALPAIVFVVAILAATAYALASRPKLGFLGAWVFIILAPTSTIVPIATQTIAEHRMYLPVAAVVVAVTLSVYRWVKPRICWCVLSILVVAAGALSYERNGDYESALSIWIDTVEKVPDNVRANTNLGYAYSVMGQTQLAVKYFSAAVKLIPDASSYSNLGISLALLGEVKEGLIVLEKAVRLSPDNPHFQAIYGNGLLVSDRLEDGIAALKSAVALKPEDASYHFDLANALVRAGRFADAEEHFKQTLKLSPDDEEALTNYGSLLREMRQLPESIELLRRASSLNPHSAIVVSNLGASLLKNGEPEEAEKHLRKAIDLNPKLPQPRFHLANLYAESGRTLEAIHHLEVLVDLAPPTAELLSNLGVLYARADRFDDAVAVLKRALKLDPDHAVARRNLDRISAYLNQR